jgi:hypothetical protein
MIGQPISYRSVAEIFDGWGMGGVCKVEDITHHSRVAPKFLPLISLERIREPRVSS